MLRTWFKRRQLRKTLNSLSDRTLEDIGINRSEINSIEVE